MARLLLANRLAYCDRPPEARPKMTEEVLLGKSGTKEALDRAADEITSAIVKYNQSTR